MKPPDSGQFIGSLIGQCLGDAMGFPVEGQNYQVCRDYVRELIEEGPVLKARPGFVIGEDSDD